MKMQPTEVIHFQKSPSSDFIREGHIKGDALQWLLYDLFKFCLETNSLFSLFAFLGFISTGKPKLGSEI